MKLIDLLVQELPRRGGWPDGAKEVVQSLIDGELYFYNKKYDGSGKITQCAVILLDKASDIYYLPDGLIGPVITREQYEAALSEKENPLPWDSNQYEAVLAASQKPAWNGEGLPPVGCECEFVSGALPTASDDYKPHGGKIVKVVSHEKYEKTGNDVVVAVWVNENNGMRASVFSPRCLRPLRTEADKKREAICDAIYGALTKAEREHNRSDEAEAVYDAIAAGKIPGVKLED